MKVKSIRNFTVSVVLIICVLILLDEYTENIFWFRLNLLKYIQVQSDSETFFFPALDNFTLEDNIDEHFGQYPLSRNNLSSFNLSNLHVPRDFIPILTDKEKLISLYVMQNFINGCYRNNITFFMQSGTLIGSSRHHGFIPWDDDMDVYVDQKDKRKLFRMNGIRQGFYITYFNRIQWKFSNSRVPKLFKHPFHWPYVDIFFYKVQGDAIYDVTYKTKVFMFNYTDVFPLKNRPFEGAFFPGPRIISKTKYYLNSDYVCISSSYLHKRERVKGKAVSTNCSNLYSVYPFVFRSKVSCVDGFTIKEELKIGDKVLNTLFIDPCSSKG